MNIDGTATFQNLADLGALSYLGPVKPYEPPITPVPVGTPTPMPVGGASPGVGGGIPTGQINPALLGGLVGGLIGSNMFPYGGQMMPGAL